MCPVFPPQQQPQTSSGVAIGNTLDLRASIETIEDNNHMAKDISLIPQPQRPVYAAPSLMSVRSCFVYPTSQLHPTAGSASHHQAVVQNHFHQYAQSQPQLSQSYSNPYIARMSNSADHLVSSSLNQLHNSTGSGNPVIIDQQQHPVMIDQLQQQLPVHQQIIADHNNQLINPDLIHDPNATLPFHEQVKNSAAHLVSGQKVTVVPDSDVNVIGTAVRIQVSVRLKLMTHLRVPEIWILVLENSIE